MSRPGPARLAGPARSGRSTALLLGRVAVGPRAGDWILEAALWCFLQTDTFETAILKAANLGDDADTTAAICGQLTGAFYGEAGIPRKWLDKLVMREDIAKLADRLYRESS